MVPRTSVEKRAVLEEQAIDVLSDVLSLLRLRGEVMCRSELSAPWGLGFSRDETYFHVVERGRALLRPAGSSDLIELRAGDLVVLPHGRGHALFDAVGSEVVPILGAIGPHTKPIRLLRLGGGGTETDLLCGRFHFDTELRMAALSGLPGVLHVRGASGEPPEWLALTVRSLTAEARRDVPGREVALSRLVDLLFIQTIRHWLEENDEPPLGWLAALRDPPIGAALNRLHAQPERDWEVEALAAEVGMSRSSFAQRFVELVGEPPSKYLTRYRVQLATRLLQLPGSTIAQTARRVGYDSEAAFSRVFKRYMHLSPASYRERSGAASKARRTR